MERDLYLADYVKNILKAQVYDIAVETPLERMNFLSGRLHNNILIKREDLQPVFSFKIRGAYNRMLHLDEEQKKRGIIAASAGNHAQGVALSAARMGISCYIVMPETTPEIKVNSVRARKANVILKGANFDEAYRYALTLADSKGYQFIHPYDDPLVIAGQGTIGMEIVRQHSAPLDAIFIPVGGGGLIAGVAAYLKYVRPEIKVVGVESEDSACLKAALEAGQRVTLEQVGIFADGVAVARVGKEPFKIAQHCVDEVITVNTDEICAAIKDIYDDTRSISEPAGALSLAGLKKYVKREKVEGANLMAIESGANLNFSRLRYISERTDLGEKSEAILGVTIPEVPGSFNQLCRIIGKHDITEFNYRYSNLETANVFMGVKLSPLTESAACLVKRLNEAGYRTIDMSDNELAKVHVRYMVGGHNSRKMNERLFRFQFPEHPQALFKFLERLGGRWNITMFHYRNHGAAFGMVFLGFDLPKGDDKELESFLQETGYRYFEETGNPAYELFFN